jgi:hypothetical protein
VDRAATTTQAPVTDKGQSAASDQTTTSGPGKGTEETFLSTFDPKDLDGKPDLQKAYKQMLGDYRKKTDAVKGREKHLAEYDEFMKDPISSASRYLSQKGYKVVQGDPDAKDDKPWEPKTWGDVQELIQKEAARIANTQTRPLQNEVKKLTQQSIEARLDNDHSDWRSYEYKMVANLQAHPTLAQDPDLLYDISIPREVREQRAYKRALEKIKSEGDSASVSGASNRPASTSKRPEGKLTLDQAWQVARKELVSKGALPS